MNSWLGVLVFVLLGLSSTRFRHVLAGTVKSRVTQLHLVKQNTYRVVLQQKSILHSEATAGRGA